MTPTSRGTDLLQLFQGNQQQVLIAAAIIGGLKQDGIAHGPLGWPSRYRIEGGLGSPRL
jgi:hypothetical protein